ncbi:hypothetical protein PK28_15050 [Hymenobacter sp. DG25B]|uniref:hypothetical protein n=1 Tax=Hymenobacter sp. DG25B TaxID=1385664 RepID=UPI000540D9AF|nr:hypothetical protein [Hymenobacter sp. DG25B]AIZ64659.1 hypothetical protein PK28_15050 [Hymenobacter sp. DG25B]
MKKLFPVLALLLVAVGCWAFYPKNAAEPGYMMLTLEVPVTGRATLVTISPTGEQAKLTLDRKLDGPAPYQAQTLIKLNELRAQGWEVVQMQAANTPVANTRIPSLGPDIMISQTFLLYKP